MNESIDEKMQAVEKELLDLAKKERELLLKLKRLRCEKTHACSVIDMLNNVQIG
tara:strand:- start:1144 stop:1305 length:162 start_codon:yes stop_codon:yes gene_type:complete